MVMGLLVAGVGCSDSGGSATMVAVSPTATQVIPTPSPSENAGGTSPQPTASAASDQDLPPTITPTVIKTETVTPRVTATPIAAPTVTPPAGQAGCPSELDPDRLVPDPLPMPDHYHVEPYVPPLLESLVFHSDVIVHASLRSVTTRTTLDHEYNYFGISPDESPVPPCSASIMLLFGIEEYLKGTGPSEILVEISLGGTYLTYTKRHYRHLEEEARAYAEDWWSKRNSLWKEGAKAALFLEVSDDDEQIYAFTHKSYDEEYGILKSLSDQPRHYERSWLPEVDEGFSGPPGDGSAPQFLRSSGPSQEGPAPTVTSLAGLRSRIAEFQAVLDEGSEIPGYLGCIGTVLWYERDARGRGKPWFPYQSSSSIRSGLPAGTAIERDNHFRGEITKFEDIWLDGPDKGLFEILQHHADDIPTEGYFESLTATRPLPSGEYKVERHFLPPYDKPCLGFMVNGFTLKRYSEETVYVESSIEGAIHEAFFDPDESTNGVGFFGDSGPMQPSSFRLRDLSIKIQHLHWQNGVAALKLDPHVPLTGFDIDVIDRDGSARITLSVSNAAVDHRDEILRWNVPEQPWQAGDQLMLRIRPEGPVPPTPGPRPWIPAVLNLTATAGMDTYGGSQVSTVRLEWVKGDAIQSGISPLSQVEVWDGTTGEWRHPFEANAGIQAMGGSFTYEVLRGINPGAYTIRVRYGASLETNAGYLSNYFASEWKYISVTVPGAPDDLQYTPTPAPPIPVPVP